MCFIFIIHWYPGICIWCLLFVFNYGVPCFSAIVSDERLQFHRDCAFLDWFLVLKATFTQHNITDFIWLKLYRPGVSSLNLNVLQKGNSKTFTFLFRNKAYFWLNRNPVQYNEFQCRIKVDNTNPTWYTVFGIFKMINKKFKYEWKNEI